MRRRRKRRRSSRRAPPAARAECTPPGRRVMHRWAMALELAKFPILVVDDEVDNLDAFRFNFRKQFHILTATGGEEALEILKATDVAVIVTDQRMPKMTGLE